MAALSRRPPATLAFDRLASEYDALVGGEIFRHLRARTHQAFVRRFGPGARVIEIGCGTGLDTCFLASHGVRVLAFVRDSNELSVNCNEDAFANATVADSERALAGVAHE